MTINAVIEGWHGTAITYTTEGKLWKYVGMRLLKDAAFGGKFVRAGKLIIAMLQLQKLVDRYDAGEIGYDTIYELYNERVLRGVRAKKVVDIVDDYTHIPATQQAVDVRLLELIEDVFYRGVITGIFSTGYKEGIRRVLRTRYGDAMPFHFIEANDLKKDNLGNVEGFSLDIYNNKHEKLPEVLRRHKIDEEKAVYIGDTQEDDGCFEIVAYPVLSPHARPEYREQFSGRYPHGFVLESTKASYKDFGEFLQKK